MPTPLSPRKKKQINAFFKNSKKTGRLVRRVRKRNDVKTPIYFNYSAGVFHTTISGERRTVKFSFQEELAKKNQAILLRMHDEAVSKKTISPKTYRLKVVPYLYTDRKVGIMEHIPGMGTRDLSRMLDPELSRISYIGTEESKSADLFLQKNPGITRNKIRLMCQELESHLKTISNDHQRFSYDVKGPNNIIITGYNNKTGIFDITLVDQIFPGDEWQVRERLKKK